MTASSRIPNFLFEFKRWASTQDQIQAVALVGSHARGTATHESDVDLIVIVSLPNVYLKFQQWTALFGDVARQQIEDYGLCTSLRVWYSDGLEVEYGFCGDTWPLDEGSRDVIARGMRVLFERLPILSPLL